MWHEADNFIYLFTCSSARIRVVIIFLTIRSYVLQLVSTLVKGNHAENLGLDCQLALADVQASYKTGEV